MNEDDESRHQETMAHYASEISRAKAAEARAQADQAHIQLRSREVDISEAATKRFESAFAAVSMESAGRRANLREAFTSWGKWASGRSCSSEY